MSIINERDVIIIKQRRDWKIKNVMIVTLILSTSFLTVYNFEMAFMKFNKKIVQTK